jgi:Holliday junction resolvase
MSGRSAQQKGKRFERKIAKQLSKFFDENVKRTPNSGGLSIKGDIININPDSILSNWEWECKNQERLNIWKALEQAENDCPPRKRPVVVFTKNFKDDYAAIKFGDFMDMLKELEELRDEVYTDKLNQN